MSKDWDPETVFEVLGSEEVRRILAAANVEPVPVQALAERLDSYWFNCPECSSADLRSVE